MIDDNSLKIFKSIAEFVRDLNEAFGEVYKPIKLYNRLVSKTTISDEGPMKKHIKLFREFCIDNKQAIFDRNQELFVYDSVSYSDKVFFSLSDILKLSDDETRPVVWNHLLVLLALVDPGSQAKKLLSEFVNKTSSSQQSNPVGETDFVVSMIKKIEKKIGDNPPDNPNDLINSATQSGIIGEIIQDMSSGLESGNLDISKLLGTMTGMLSGLNSGNTDFTNPQSIIESGQQSGNGLDLSSMLGPMMSMMSGVANQTPSVTYSPEEKLRKELDSEFQKEKSK